MHSTKAWGLFPKLCLGASWWGGSEHAHCQAPKEAAAVLPPTCKMTLWWMFCLGASRGLWFLLGHCGAHSRYPLSFSACAFAGGGGSDVQGIRREKKSVNAGHLPRFTFTPNCATELEGTQVIPTNSTTEKLHALHLSCHLSNHAREKEIEVLHSSQSMGPNWKPLGSMSVRDHCDITQVSLASYDATQASVTLQGLDLARDKEGVLQGCHENCRSVVPSHFLQAPIRTWNFLEQSTFLGASVKPGTWKREHWCS